ncbi:MAG: hypothetical protein H6Q90_2296 [Deltaproteobacteria bacterium]|nr:hypothetical protein [Deltaproteobacteria bacterium]
MRTILLAVFAVSLAPGGSPVDACGYLEPRTFLVSTHHIPGIGTPGRTRTFAVLGEPAPRDATWQLLAPAGYDTTRIADAAPLDAPLTLTLLGPSGARVVSSARRAFLWSSMQFAPSAVLELDAEAAHTRVALAGSLPGAVWIGLDDAGRSVSRLHGTKLETVLVMPNGDREPVTLVRRDGQEVARSTGRPIGAMRLYGMHYLFVERAGIVTSVPI